MLKQNKRKLLISSAVILLPALVGLLLWNRLPDRMTTHWGADGIADGWSGKAFAVFALPLILLAFHWLCLLFTAKDPGNRGQSPKVFSLVIWIMPIVSLFANGTVYAAALEWELRMELVTMLLMGVLFIAMGNYLPKCKPNRTIGIKIKWTFESEENWYATHRLAGRLWVAGGLLFMVCGFLPISVMAWVSVIAFAIMIVVPVVYSYAFYRKQLQEGTFTPAKMPESKGQKRMAKISVFIMVLILIGCAILMFSGNIAVTYEEDAFTIEADYWPDLTVEYDAVGSVEYRTEDTPGVRTGGFGSARLMMGNFRNEEFGNYTRYSYTGRGPCVVVTSEEKILVLGGRNVEETERIYQTLLEKIQ